MRDCAELERSIGRRFSNQSLLHESLTHSSFANEQPGVRPADNERLEFLGDAVLAFVISDVLFTDNPGVDEGKLSKMRAFLVSAANLVRYAEELQLGEYLRLGRGEENSGGRRKPALLVNAFEAIVGALYLDAGLDQTREFLLGRFERQISDMSLTSVNAVDCKSVLQETVQESNDGFAEYRLVEESGPDHRKLFRVEVCVGGQRVAEGTGLTKKAAEQEAAKGALQVLESLPNELSGSE